MKIAVLNLPFDNNYGGNLQRFALMECLRRMGHDVEYLYIRRNYELPCYKKPYSYAKRLIQRYGLRKNVKLYQEKEAQKKDYRQEALALLFLEGHVRHTRAIYGLKDLKETIRTNSYDAFVVGSDQVWRKSMTKGLGLENYFFKFTKGHDLKRIAYSVSLGTTNGEWSKRDVRKIRRLYEKFDTVSVREYQTLDFFTSIGFEKPQATWTVDPTLLIGREEYIRLIESGDTDDMTTGKLFCYVLDHNKQTTKTICEKQKEIGIESYIMGLEESYSVSIEQWLNNIRCSSLVITDSFHGVVFSIIFNRPFLFLGNGRRGNLRIESLLRMLEIDANGTTHIDWNKTNDIVRHEVEQSKDFLRKALS